MRFLMKHVLFFTKFAKNFNNLPVTLKINGNDSGVNEI